MIGHENVIFRKDESVEFGKLFWTALVGIVLVLAGLGKDLWASKLWPLLLVLLVIAAALQAAGKTRELPELVELQGHELFVQISRNEHYRIPIDVVRALEVSGEDVCFVFRKKEANALGLAIPKKAKRHLSRLLGRLDSPSGTDHGDGAFEFTMPKAALEALLSRMAKQFKWVQLISMQSIMPSLRRSAVGQGLIPGELPPEGIRSPSPATLSHARIS